MDRKDEITKDLWIVFKVIAEFVEGFEELSKIPERIVAVFGSSKKEVNKDYYKLTEEIGKALAENGYAVLTGAGEGLMEAANKGASLAGGVSIGLNIVDIKSPQIPNRYVNKLLEFKYFFIRKFMFIRYSVAAVITPGGFGTLDELFEILTLIQTGKVDRFPVILVSKKYWKGLVDWLKNTAIPNNTLLYRDLELFHIVDTPEEVVDIINKSVADKT